MSQYDASFESENPEATIGVVLHLSWLRSAAKLGFALMTKFPDEDSWNRFLGSREFLEMVDEFSPVIVDMRAAAELVGPELTPEAIQQAVEQHYGRALQAVDELAHHLDVPGEDLLAFLVQR